MTPGTKSGGGAEKDKHSAENDKNSAENDEIEVPKKSAETGGNRCFATFNITQTKSYFILMCPATYLYKFFPLQTK
jgi:hypothetical protein